MATEYYYDGNDNIVRVVIAGHEYVYGGNHGTPEYLL